MILHALHLRPFLLFLLPIDLLIQVLHVFRRLRLLSLRFPLIGPPLSLVLRLHFLLVLLDDVEEVLRHEDLVAELVQQEHESHGDSWGYEEVPLCPL